MTRVVLGGVLGTLLVGSALLIYRKVFRYREIPLSDVKARLWAAQARAAKDDGQWPVVRRAS